MHTSSIISNLRALLLSSSPTSAHCLLSPPFFSLAPTGRHIPPPHLAPLLHTVFRLLASSSSHSCSWAHLTSPRFVRTSQLFAGDQQRGGASTSPEETHCICCGSPWCCQQEKWVPGSPSPEFTQPELAFCVCFQVSWKTPKYLKANFVTSNQILPETTCSFFIKQREEVDIIPLESYKSLNSNFFLLL